MNIPVEVRSGDLKGGGLKKTTKCAIVMVSVDADGKPVAVEPFHPTNDAGKMLAAEVKKRLVGR